MTLLIAYLLLWQMGAAWFWYPIVFVLWFAHLVVMQPSSTSTIFGRTHRE